MHKELPDKLELQGVRQSERAGNEEPFDLIYQLEFPLRSRLTISIKESRRSEVCI